MYELLTDFLRDFSRAYPLLWALLVMAALGLAGLGLHLFWQLILRGAGRLFSGGGAASGMKGGAAGKTGGDRGSAKTGGGPETGGH